MQLPQARVPEWQDVDRARFAGEILPLRRPAVLKGLVKDWPAVQAAEQSPEGAARYLARFDRGAPVEAFVGPPDIGGRFFYRPDMSGFNFERKRARLSDVVERLLQQKDAETRLAIYIGAAPVPQCLPGLEGENPLPLLDGKGAVPRVWIGSDITVAAHFDLSDNIACVVGGRRRFVLFPPDQVANLYIGPLDNTMAGQPASMVSLEEPDFEKHPRFRQALDHALVADLEPGDAIYIPTPWWHHVGSLTPFNILINHWWDEAPADAGSPFEALAHGILSISNLPEGQRDAWRSLFDHYVFKRNGEPAAHLPPDRRGILGAPTPQLRSMMREFLARALARRL